MDKRHGFYLYTAETAQWHALISEAEAIAGHALDPEIGNYLVFTMTSFLGPGGERTAEIKHHQLLNTGGLVDQDLRDTGDICLLFSGLLPDYVSEHWGPVGDMIALGRSAYRELASRDSSQLFLKMSAQFMSIVDVLLNIRVLSGEHRHVGFLDEYQYPHPREYEPLANSHVLH